jgi:hypothetical protein
MRENRLSGSEGGGTVIPSFLPLVAQFEKKADDFRGDFEA